MNLLKGVRYTRALRREVQLWPCMQRAFKKLEFDDDMVEALALALEHPNAIGESFNVGNARSAVTIYDLALRIKRMTGLEHELVFQPLHYTDVELRVPNADKARELLGFEAKVELDEGLERTIAWYRENTSR